MHWNGSNLRRCNLLHQSLDCISAGASFNIVAAAMPERSDVPIQVVALRLTDTWPRADKGYSYLDHIWGDLHQVRYGNTCHPLAL